MENKKNRNINTLIGIIIILLFLVIIELTIYIIYKPNNVFNTQNNNNAIEGENNTENLNNDNYLITSDQITNDKVQEIYDIVKIEKFPVFSYPNYIQDGFINNLHNQIVIAMDNKEKLLFTAKYQKLDN